MHFGSRSQIAVKAMVEVALREPSGPVTLHDISARQERSLSYMAALFSELRQHGLVTSVRGPGGGYTLSRSADSITAADIVVAVVDDLEWVKASDMVDHCPKRIAQDLWNLMNANALDYMKSITLHSLVLERVALGANSAQKKTYPTGVLPKPITPSIQSSPPNSVFALGRSLLVQT
jgi:Rrf2 family iron-sulfur cluster assembly transcriptional regulator